MKSKSSETKTFQVALVGNPNAGKTTLFNALSGARQKIANYPGVTVEEVSSESTIDGVTVNFIDVPGLYSLEAVSEDEAVAAAVIHRENIDLLVCIIDGSNLERNLYIYTQLAALGKPILVAVTMLDRVTKSGKQLDLKLLSERLHTPVIGLSGPLPDEVKLLKSKIVECIKSRPIPHPVIERRTSLEVLQERMTRIGYDFTLEQLEDKLKAGEQEFESFFVDFPELKEDYDNAVAGKVLPVEPSTRYKWTQDVQRETTTTVSKPKRQYRLTDRIDYFLIHRVWGLAIFVAIMLFVFQCIYTFSAPLMDGIEAAFGWMGDQVGARLADGSILESFIVDGVIAGVGGVVVFLPQILILFLLISILEGTGYLARAAFLMDRLLGWCGLNGRAFIPLLSSFACAIPGIMAARVMPDPKSRLATILVAPLMSCSARLPVYLVLIGAFIEPRFGPLWAGFTLFAMHMLGFVIAVPVVYFLNRKMLKGKRLPFLLELP
ncbi:MAG TPA: ferrous iron transport protein B, partial [Fimbriimonas sp.]|nr:ferrous iron transport protein B [Fimbriimonas sp.]